MLSYSFDSTQSSFFTVLKKRVGDHFTQHNLCQTGERRLIGKGVVLITSAAGLYLMLVFFTPVSWVALTLCMLLGLNLALIGFNVMHDGGHQSFSKYQLVNTLAAHFLNVLGGTAHFWKIKHNINHHTYTNIEGLDSDIDVKPFMRLHADQPLKAYHRFQHVYGVVLYGISYVVWVFYEDFQKYFSGRISVNSPKKKLPLKQHFIFWATKVLYVLLYIVIPFVSVGWLPWLIGFIIITFVCGFAISVVFQLAHVVEGTLFHSVTGSSKSDWAIHQVQSTANFDTQNPVMHWLLGGLNFQIEHHLFPRVSHIHYPVIATYVKQTCDEYGIQYNEHASILSAIVSHFNYLHSLGQVGHTVHTT